MDMIVKLEANATHQYQPGDLVRLRRPMSLYAQGAVFVVHGVNKRGVQVSAGITENGKSQWVAVDPRRLEPVHDHEAIQEQCP